MAGVVGSGCTMKVSQLKDPTTDVSSQPSQDIAKPRPSRQVERGLSLLVDHIHVRLVLQEHVANTADWREEDRRLPVLICHVTVGFALQQHAADVSLTIKGRGVQDGDSFGILFGCAGPCLQQQSDQFGLVGRHGSFQRRLWALPLSGAHSGPKSSSHSTQSQSSLLGGCPISLKKRPCQLEEFSHILGISAPAS